MMPFDREERSFYSGLIVKKQLYCARFESLKQLYRFVEYSLPSYSGLRTQQT
jgi:hypothetical protein